MKGIELLRVELLKIEAMVFAYQSAYQGDPLSREESELAEFFLDEIFEKIEATSRKALELTKAEVRAMR